MAWRIFLASVLLALAWTPPSLAQAVMKHRVDIPAQELAAALAALAKQTKIQLVYPAELVAGQSTRALNGSMTPEEALLRLLAETDLKFEFIDPRTVTLTLLRGSSASQAAAVTSGVSRLVTAEAGSFAASDTDRGSRLAQGSAQESEDETTREPTTRRDELTVMEEIVVTGTHIRGAGAAVGSRVETISRAEIDQSGFATTQQVLQSLPQNFQGGPNEDTFVGEAGTNVTGASSVNLRGLSSDSTLLLVNGRRVPVAGANANFYDLSGVPSTAIERIEVLSDGASAIYGSDAIAGVVNIVLRKDYEGAETRLRYGSVSDGDLREIQFGQILGANWDSGNGLLSYEYYQRDPLRNAERAFANNSDLRPLGGSNFSDTFSNPGNILDLSTFEPAFAIPAGQDGTNLQPGDLLPGVINFRNKNEGRNLLQDQDRDSVFATVSQRLRDGIDVFAEGRYTWRDFRISLTGQGAILTVPPSNPFFVDPFGDSPFVVVFYNLTDDIGPLRSQGDVQSGNGVLGSTLDFGRDWQLQVYGAYSRERSHIVQEGAVDFEALTAALADPNPATAFNPFGDGSHTNPATLAAIMADPDTIDQTSEVRVANATADGTLWMLPGGAVKLAAGADYRKESFDVGFSASFRGITQRKFDRDVTALFAELFVPLIGENNRQPGLERLTFSLAGRYEDYDDVGSTINPKFGVTWSPLKGLAIRGTYGTSFKAPNLSDLNELFNSILVIALPDPSSPSGATTSLVQFGNNRDLDNEESTNWTAGIDFNPPGLPDLTVGLTYFNIDFKDRIRSPRNVFSIFFNEARFAPVINRNPTQAQIDALCNSEFFDPALGDCTQQISAIVDARLNNLARTKIEGLDLSALYGFNVTGAGRLDLRLQASYLTHFTEAITDTAPAVSLVNTMNNPVELRMRASLTWSQATGFAATAFVNYANSYTDDVSEPDRKIDSWTTVDLTLSFNTQDRLRGVRLDNTAFTLSALNLFDEDPPFANNPQGVGYDPENADPLGRFLSFNIIKSW